MLTVEELTSCCGSHAWVSAMHERQPFADAKAVHDAAEAIWRSLSEADWLEAFAKHPKIGEKSAARWSAQEQSGMDEAKRDVGDEMLRLNREYEARFGFIYIVFAAGKSARAMLEILQRRINNTREEELANAGREQAAILHARLDKLALP